jgi:HTH-type transcriptional repressor of NAD biosynthesis genes
LPTANPDHPRAALVIALLGGESTGKSTLAADLKSALQEQGIATTLVPEFLRSWCETKGRAPTRFEQAGLAGEQAHQIVTAMHRAPPVQVVIADTTPLVIATYSEIYFQDTSLYPAALVGQRQVDLNLLMGLDVPWVPDGLFRDGPALRERTDEILRHQLQTAELPFHTVYGLGPARLQAALRIVEQALKPPLDPRGPSIESAAAAWSCERCSDPECERRLFSRLL